MGNAIVQKHLENVSLEVRLSSGRDILEWACAKLGFEVQREEDNPLTDKEFFVMEEPDLEETGLFLTVLAEKKTSGEFTHQLRYELTTEATHAPCTIREAVAACETPT